MLRVLLLFVRLVISVPVLEFAGFCFAVSGAAVLGGLGAALVAAGVLCFVKAFDVALPKGD